jgi:hypothetical protein
MTTPHPSWTVAAIVRLLDERAALLQRLTEQADTIAELADLDAAASEIRLLRLELTDPTRQKPIAPPTLDDDVDIHTMEPTA